jgi:general secretion pathway protein D
MVAQDYAVDSDVVLESAVREIKSAPRDTVNVIGDGMKYVADETVTAAKGVAAAFKSDPIEKVEKAAMLEVANAWDSSNDIVFRSYKISKSVGEELLGSVDTPEGDVIDVSAAFYGIEFPKKASAFFRPEFNRLFVRNTLDNIFSIEDVLAELHSAERDLMGKQVSIETKFVEVNQGTLDELGFNWRFDSKSGGAAEVVDNLTIPSGQDLFASGLRTAAGALGTEATAGSMLVQKVAGSLRWSMIISALEQSEGTDVLSAPSIVTRDGSTASILVGEERTVSSGFDVKNSESSLYVEHDLEVENMGVMLEVTPELRSDSLIDLELKPKVIDLIGYDDYLVHPEAAINPIQGNILRNSYNQGRYPIITKTIDGATTAIGELYSVILDGDDINNDRTGNETTSPIYYETYREYTYDELPQAPALWGRMPFYRLREMETQLTVADGSTIGMGGLIYDKLETFRDKVPVLGSIPLIGRLFRSEGEKSTKRNLMIFVTATQVDVNGRKASDLAMKK